MAFCSPHFLLITELSVLPCLLHSEYLWYLWISLKSLTNTHHGIKQILLGSEFPSCRMFAMCCSFVLWNHRLVWDLKHRLIPTCHGQGHLPSFCLGGSVAFSTPLHTFGVLFLCRNRYWVVLGVPNPPSSPQQFRFLFCPRHSLVLTQLFPGHNGQRKFSKGRREGIALEFEIGSCRQAPPKFW